MMPSGGRRYYNRPYIEPSMLVGSSEELRRSLDTKRDAVQRQRFRGYGHRMIYRVIARLTLATTPRPPNPP